MKAWFLKLVPVACAVLVFWGCSSIPAKAGTDESLVIIKTEFVNPDNLPRGFEMAFNYSGDYPSTWVGQYSWDFNVVVVKEPGVMLKSVAPRIQAGFRGGGKDFDVDLALPYERGRIVIADFVFVQTKKKVTENSFENSWKFRTATAQEKSDLMQALKADGRFASWFKEDE